MIRSKLKIFEIENPTIYKQFVAFLQDHSMASTAEEYASYFKMKPGTLLNNLRTWVKKYDLRGKGYGDGLTTPPVAPAPAIVPPSGVQVPVNEDGLTEEEEKFLTKFRSGEVPFEEIQREFAYRVLRKVMADPRLLKASDWLRSEVIKIQREELSMKKEQMDRAWGMIFGGFKIPRHCPNCGHDLQPKVASPNDEAIIIANEDSNDHEHANGSLETPSSIS